MTTSEIEKQLVSKSCKQINEHAELIVKEMQEFGKINTLYNRNCMHWYQRHYKPVKKYSSDPEPEDPFDHFNWDELAQLIRRNMEHNLLDLMVEKKAKELLTKMDLFE